VKKNIIVLLGIVLAVVLLAGALAGCGGTTTTTTKAPTATTAAGDTGTASGDTTATSAAATGDLVIGGVYGITGKYAGGEAGMGYGTKMAIEEINAAGGINGQKLVYDIEDTGSEQAGAVNAFNRMAAKKPVAIFNTCISGYTMAQLPDIEKAQIPTYCFADAPDISAQGNQWILRPSTPDKVTPSMAVKFAVEEVGGTKVAILYVNNDFGQVWDKYMIEWLAGQKMKEVVNETFGPDDKDMTAQLNKVKQSGADVMVVVADPLTHAAILKQRTQLGLTDVAYVGSDAAVYPETLALLTNGEAEGIYSLTASVPPQDPDPKVREWAAKYKELYGIDADTIGANAYDAVMIFADAVKAVGTDGAKIRAWVIENVQGYKGMGNTYRFQANGDGGTQMTVVQIVDGQPKILKTMVYAN
jgi:branched-chain amino acid transport system substrate-binding protein